jgi:hypothetical protein
MTSDLNFFNSKEIFHQRVTGINAIQKMKQMENILRIAILRRTNPGVIFGKEMSRVFALFFIAAALSSISAHSQCACCAGASTGSSNGDYNNGILTLSKKQFVAESYADYRTISNKNHVGHQQSSETTTEKETPLKSMFIPSIGLRYGISNKITVSALLPLVFLQTDNGNDNGVGDLMLLGTMKVFSKNNFNLALQAGVELPTGVQKGANFDNTTVVVGSGSVDPMAGILFSNQWGKFILRGNALYKQTTSGFEQNYYGSLAVQNLSVAYRLRGQNSFCSTDSLVQNPIASISWTVFGGYYGEWLDNLKEGDTVDENSGYYLGFATLGTNISYKKWGFPLTVSLPIIQQMNGDQNNAGYRLRLGVIRSF